MRRFLVLMVMAAGLAVLVPALAQPPAVTAACRDGTAFSGTSRSGACRGHKGVQTWGDAAPLTTVPAASPAPAQRAPSVSKRLTRNDPVTYPKNS